MHYFINEITFSDYTVYNLYLLYIIAILLGVLVIISKNPNVAIFKYFFLFNCKKNETL